MRSISLSNSKRLLAVLLTMLLFAALLTLLTYNASAGNYYSVDGVVTGGTMETITILAKGRYRTFGISGAHLLQADDGVALKDTVRIIYAKVNPKDAVQIIMLQEGGNHMRVRHDPKLSGNVVGTVTNLGMSTISVMADGTKYSYSKEDADILNAPDGILVGDKVKIVFDTNNRARAIQVILISHGENHDEDTFGIGPANRSWSGWVSDMGSHTITVQSLTNGTSYTYYYDDSVDSTPNGIAISDVVKVLYNNNFPGVAKRIVMVDEGDNH